MTFKSLWTIELESSIKTVLIALIVQIVCITSEAFTNERLFFFFFFFFFETTQAIETIRMIIWKPDLMRKTQSTELYIEIT